MAVPYRGFTVLWLPMTAKYYFNNVITLSSKYEIQKWQKLRNLYGFRIWFLKVENCLFSWFSVKNSHMLTKMRKSKHLIGNTEYL